MRYFAILILSFFFIRCETKVVSDIKESGEQKLSESENITIKFYSALQNKNYPELKKLVDSSFINDAAIEKLKLRDSLFGDMLDYEIIKVNYEGKIDETSEEAKSAVHIIVNFKKKEKPYHESLLITHEGNSFKIIGYNSEVARKK